MGTTATFTSRKSRFLAGLPAELHLDDRDLPVRAFDLSRSGVLITGEFDPPTKQWVRVTLRSVNGDLELTVTARVARVVTDLDEQQRGIGLELPRLDAAECRTLDALVARVLEGMVPAALAALPRGAHTHEVRAALEQIPLAQRIALAARATPRERELLVRDASPLVLEALARNPAISLTELRLLARRRDLPAPAIAQLAKSRWAHDTELKVLLVGHPRVQLSVAARVASTLNPAEVKRALMQPGLHPAIKLRLLKQQSLKRRAGW